MSLFVDSPGAMLGLTRFGKEFTGGSFHKILSNIRQNSGYGLGLRKQLEKDRLHTMEPILGLIEDN